MYTSTYNDTIMVLLMTSILLLIKRIQVLLMTRIMVIIMTCIVVLITGKLVLIMISILVFMKRVLVLIMTRILVLIMMSMHTYYSFYVLYLMCLLRAQILPKLPISHAKFNRPSLGKGHIFIVFQNKENCTCCVT